LRQAGGFCLALNVSIDGPALLGNLGQVANAFAGDQHGGAGLFLCRVDIGRPRGCRQIQFLTQQPQQVHEHPGHPRIVELAGNGRVDRHVRIGQVEFQMVAFPLLAHIPQRVLRGAAVVLVKNDEVGVVQHVDFLQLALRAKIRSHDINRQIHEIDDLGIGLADAGGFHHHQVETGRFQKSDGIGKHGRGGQMLPPGGHRAHVDPFRTQ